MMNIKLEEFARESIKEMLDKCNDKEREKFRKMYGAKSPDLDMGGIVNTIPVGKMNTVMTQVSKTVDAVAQILMPTELTAENGAKDLLIGEFFENLSLACQECDTEGCIDCEGTGYTVIKIPVSWTNIKGIYKKLSQHFGEDEDGSD